MQILPFPKDFQDAYAGHLEKPWFCSGQLSEPLGFCGILALCKNGVSQGFSRCVCWALGKTLGFVVVSFLINRRPTPRILWNSGFAQLLLFPKDFQDAYVGHLEKTLIC